MPPVLVPPVLKRSQCILGVLVLSLLNAQGGETVPPRMEAQNPAWYAESLVHAHHSTGKPAPEWREQIDRARPDAVQFHHYAYDAGQALARDHRFAFVCTLTLSGGWNDVGRVLDKLPPSELAKFSPRLNPDGSPAGRIRGDQLWQHLCLNSPGIDDHLISVYADTTRRLHPDQIWIDHTVITVNLCYCSFCCRGFSETYGRQPPAKASDALWPQWVEFHRKIFERWMRRTRDAVKAADPNTIVTFNHAYFLAQPEPPPPFIENLSADLHSQPLFLSLFARYATTLGVPFDLMTGLTDRWAGSFPKSEDAVKREAAIITANGGRWNIGEFPASRDTQPADAMLALAAKGADFVRERQEWTRHTESVPLVAVLQSASTQYARVIRSGQSESGTEGEMVASDSGRMEFRRSGGPGVSRIYWYSDRSCPVEVTGAGTALLESNIPFDIINEATLQKRLGEYRLLIVPDQFILDRATIAQIESFVEGGGTVLASGRTIDSDLAPILGVSPVSGRPRRNDTLRCGDLLLTVSEVQDFTPAAATVRQSFGPSDSRPAFTERAIGRGTVHYLAGDFFRAYYERSPYSARTALKPGNRALRSYFRQLLAQVAPRLGYASSAPPWCEVALRRHGTEWLVHLIDRLPEWGAGNEAAVDLVDLELPLPVRPSRVTLQPGARPLKSHWRDGTLFVSVPTDEVRIHSIIQIAATAH